jgi:hypothetical protein
MAIVPSKIDKVITNVSAGALHNTKRIESSLSFTINKTLARVEPKS